MEQMAEQLIPFAVRAPSGHNTQPWQFSVEQDTIRIYPDLSRREVSVRQDGLAAVALGFPSVPRWLGRWIMTTLLTPEGEAARQEKAIRSSSLLLIRLGYARKRLPPAPRRPVDQVIRKP